MAIIEHDWVWETATVSGTGSVTLPGTPAQTGARTFVSVYANNDQCPYVIADNTTGASESGIGTITVSGTVATLARTVVIESTNSNNLVDFAGNACGVFVTKAPGVQASAGAADAGKVPLLNGSGVLSTTTSPLGFVPTSGAWYFSASAPNGSGTPNANTIYYVWVRLLRAATWTHMAVSQYGSPSAATNLRFGAYSADPTTGAPSTLLSDCGTVTFSTSVTPTLAFPTPLATDAPGFWAAVGTDTTLNGFPWVFTGNTISARGAPEDLGGLYPALNGAQVSNVNAPISQILYTQSWTFGALPSAASSLVLGSTTAPLVSLQAQ